MLILVAGGEGEEIGGAVTGMAVAVVVGVGRVEEQGWLPGQVSLDC